MSGSCLNQGSDDLNSSGGHYTDGRHPQLVVALPDVSALAALNCLFATKSELGVNLNTASAVGIARLAVR
jgi:hypothetical protein